MHKHTFRPSLGLNVNRIRLGAPCKSRRTGFLSFGIRRGFELQTVIVNRWEDMKRSESERKRAHLKVPTAGHERKVSTRRVSRAAAHVTQLVKV